MDEKTAKAIARMESTRREVAATQVSSAIGEAVLALHDAGKPVLVEALIAHLLNEAAPLEPTAMVRFRNELAARRLGYLEPGG